LGVATVAQKDDLFAKFECSLQQAHCIPPNLEMAFDLLLVWLSTQKRLKFLERNQENLRFIRSQTFKEMFPYMQFVLEVRKRVKKPQMSQKVSL
jgi:hypothetical protein